MIRLCLAGGLGRMGRAIAALAGDTDDVEIASVFESPEAVTSAPDYAAAAGYARNPVVVTSDAGLAAAEADVVVDFSLPPAFGDIVTACESAGVPLVTGTTGVPDKEGRLARLSGEVAVVSSPNMSVGMNLVFALCRKAGAVMGKTADIEIVEMHHRTKRDVPSGTARSLASILSDLTGKPVVVGRTAETAMRGDEIAIHSLRAGDVPGNHSVILTPEGETVEIRHSARSRVCFAGGALRAARFAVSASPGLYTMLDVLGLK